MPIPRCSPGGCARGGRRFCFASRYRPDALPRRICQGALADLAWLGLTWDARCAAIGAFRGLSRGARRLGALELIYPCFCTRAAIRAEIARAGNAPHGPKGRSIPAPAASSTRRAARRRESGRASRCASNMAARGARGIARLGRRAGGAVRADPASHGDAVLARKELPTSYHLAVTVDDALQGVTLVTRGEDLFTATHIHRLLQRCSTSRCRATATTPAHQCERPAATPSATARLPSRRCVPPGAARKSARPWRDSLTEGGAPERRNAGVRQSSIQLLAQSRNDRDIVGSSGVISPWRTAKSMNHEIDVELEIVAGAHAGDDVTCRQCVRSISPVLRGEFGGTRVEDEQHAGT